MLRLQMSAILMKFKQKYLFTKIKKSKISYEEMKSICERFCKNSSA